MGGIVERLQPEKELQMSGRQCLEEGAVPQRGPPPVELVADLTYLATDLRRDLGRVARDRAQAIPCRAATSAGRGSW